MKIKIELDIQNCYECPFVENIHEHGFCGNCCQKIAYGMIPKQGIRKDCPFKNKNVDKKKFI